jgi:molecular chaperone DnaK (HSP70)
MAAKRHAVTDPHNTVVAVKRLLGHGYESEEIQEARTRVPYPIRPSPLGSVLLEIGGKELTPVQVSARILQKVREVAEEALGEPVEKAVISVPAHFNDVQRKATKVAAEYAGLEVLRLINEPTAAAFAYGYRKDENFTLAVYDLGGGTFDITIMTAKGDTFEVDATDGDSYLGGEDFDHAVVEWLLSEFQAEHGQDLRGDETARLRIKGAAEQAKVELSDVTETQIDLPFLTELPDGSRPHFARRLTRGHLDELTQPLVQRTIELCKRCIQNAGLIKDDVDDVLMVGGQSRMNSVREAVRELFGKEPRRDINPDEVVAMGAALFGYSLAADELKDEAVEAAEDAFAIAYKQTAIARKVLHEVDHLADTQGTDTLASKLQLLLDHADAELPSLAGPPKIAESDLPAAVDKLRDELMQIERKAAEVMLKAELEIKGDVGQLGEAAEERAEEFSALADRFNEQVSQAHQASEHAQQLLNEAQGHRSARRVDLIDVTSHALGIAAAGDVFTQLIAQNTPVPAEEVRVFTTQQDGQTEVEIHVYQGNRRYASENQELGNFILAGLPPEERMKVKIDVAFRVDEDGILDVSARDAVSGVEQEIRVEDPLALRQETADGSHEQIISEG